MDKTPDAVGYILDGFPRNVHQATALDSFFVGEGTEVSLLVELIVSDQEIINRITSRGKIEGRKDDQDTAIVQNRIDIYKSQTAPVADHYDLSSKTKRIDGLGSIEDIFQRICTVLDTVAV
jgi:adenylate kinase